MNLCWLPYVTIASAAQETDIALVYLLLLVVALMVIIMMLYKGRHPWDVGVDRYDQAYFTDPRVPYDALKQINGYLFQRDYCAAHRCMLNYTNWFFPRRESLPQDFANLWLMIRTRVNRMAVVHNWPQDWAEHDVECMRTETLRLLDRAILILDEFVVSDEEEMPTSMDQSIRSIEAPSDKSFSSMHS